MAAGGKTFIHLPIYVATCLFIDLLSNPEYTYSAYHFMAAGGKTFIHLPIYVATCLSIDLLQILNIQTVLTIYIGLYIH